MKHKHFWVDCAPGVKLSVNRYPADGQQILLIHGLASNSGLYLAMCDILNLNGYDVLSIDLRGHGMSNKPASGYDYKTISNDIESVLEYFKLKSPLLVGQSWGGNIVIDFLSRYQKIAMGGVLIDGGWINLKHSFNSLEDAKAALSPPKFEQMTINQLESGFRQIHSDWPELSIEGALMNFSTDKNGFVIPKLSFDNHMRILKQLYEDNPVSKAQKITEPVLLVVAGPRTPDKVNQLNSLEISLKYHKTLWFEDAVHDIHAQMPDTVSDVIKKAIETGIFSK